MKKFFNDNGNWITIVVAAIAIFAFITSRRNATILKEAGLTADKPKTTNTNTGE